MTKTVDIDVEARGSTGHEGGVYDKILESAGVSDFDSFCRAHGLNPRKATVNQVMAASRKERAAAGLPTTGRLSGRLK